MAAYLMFMFSILVIWMGLVLGKLFDIHRTLREIASGTRRIP